jgi:hypothetical protein
VTNEDGSDADLLEHLGNVHQKGTNGLSEDYLANLHHTLHQRRREPLLEHTHPGYDPVEPAEPAADELQGE